MSCGTFLKMADDGLRPFPPYVSIGDFQSITKQAGRDKRDYVEEEYDDY